MFERYTEKARRTIFFARYEAAQVRSHFIETEHLLLALIREEKRNLSGFLKPGAVDDIQRELHALAPSTSQEANASVDIPLSNQSKRVLAYAAEEAERLHDRHIGTEHFFLALLREKETTAARTLVKFGADLSVSRERISKIRPDYGSPGSTNLRRFDPTRFSSMANYSTSATSKTSRAPSVASPG